MQLQEIKKGCTGTGLLIENDGYISIDSDNNKVLKESVDNFMSGAIKELPRPFVVSAVFQKYDIENANGRIYPKNILQREVEKYVQIIKDRRGYGECYKGSAMVLTECGWKSIKEVKEGEYVLTLNPSSNKIELQPIIRTISRNHSGIMYHLKGNNIDECVTPKHGYPIYNNKNNFEKFITAEELFNCKDTLGKHYYIPSLSENVLLNELEITEEEYNGHVYCIEVPNHIWYVMENGKCHWTKNCNHPTESTIDVERICMNIIELHWVGHTLVGKMELPITEGFRRFGIVSCLADLVAHWIISGLKIGVSSRGLGTVSQMGGKLVVNDDYEIVCWDVVSQPSTPQAFIEMEESDLKPYIQEQVIEKQSVILNEDRFSKFDSWLNG